MKAANTPQNKNSKRKVAKANLERQLNHWSTLTTDNAKAQCLRISREIETLNQRIVKG